MNTRPMNSAAVKSTKSTAVPWLVPQRSTSPRLTAEELDQVTL